ncbi:MAG: S-layer protein [Candidatus Micrarchaeota archaeon]
MKVNLKKIGAIVAGATILASSAAFAGLMFGSTTLVDDNGAPVAKVVVGSNGAPSDGVAAALIAGKIVSEAYKSTTLTAQVSGTATCTSTDEGSGTCAISNEKAKLEITVPNSVAAGTWTGDNLIGDYLNRKLVDREINNISDTDSAYTAGGIDTSATANPFTDGTSGNDLGISETLMYRISGTEFTPFETTTITDPDSSNVYTEYQYLWLRGDNHYDTDVEDVVGRIDFLAYTLKFDGPGSDELGIPYCTKSNSSNDYTECTEDYETATHKVKINFLGEEWIISQMEHPGDDGLTNEYELQNGGTVWLAKEAVSGILNQGESLPIDDLKFQLDDLEAHGDSTSAILSILDANGNVLKKDKVDPATTKEFNVNGKTYRFHVYKVAPGYTFGAKWADVAIYSKELELSDGDELDASNNLNNGYQVLLGWKNKGGTTTDNDADTLRTIVLYADDVEEISSSGDNILTVGDYLSIVQDPTAWKLTYKGLDIASSDRVNLKFQLKTSDKTISDSSGPLNSSSVQTNCTIEAPYMQVDSSSSSAVFITDRDDVSSTDGLSDNSFYIALGGATCGLSATSAGLRPGSVFMRVSLNGDYGYHNYTEPLEVKYSAIGDGDTNFISSTNPGGMMVIQNSTFSGTDDALGELMNLSDEHNNYTINTGTDSFYIGIAEKAYPAEFADYWTLGVDEINSDSPEDATFDFDGYNVTGDVWLMSDNEELGYFYAGPVTTQWTNAKVDVGFVSERGSRLSAISASSITLQMAHKLAHAEWFLASSGSTVEDSSATVVTLGEGESTTVSGVTVKVLEITETVGACSAAGGAPACTADMEGVSAVIMPNNAPSVTVAMPYTGTYGNLVVLDSDAVGVNTLVSVGGDKVNSVTAGLLQGTPVDWTVERKVVREVVQGSKIVVAGTDAVDTLEAAQDFVAQLQKVQ